MSDMFPGEPKFSNFQGRNMVSETELRECQVNDDPPRILPA